MAATARVVVLMEPSEKSRLDKQAKSAGLSMGEFVRQRVLGRDEQHQEIAAILPVVRQSTHQANAALDRLLARRARLDAEAERREKSARAKAREEFADINFASLARALSVRP